MVKNIDNKRKSYILTNIPEDVYNIIKERQKVEKKRLNHSFTIQQTIYKIIKESIKNDTSNS